jgi:hypothetical protein
MFDEGASATGNGTGSNQGGWVGENKTQSKAIAE